VKVKENAYFEITRRFEVDQMKTPDLQADATYTPFTDIEMAVIAPIAAGSEYVETLFQSLLDIVMSSVDRHLSTRHIDRTKQ